MMKRLKTTLIIATYGVLITSASLYGGIIILFTDNFYVIFMWWLLSTIICGYLFKDKA